MQSTYLEVQMKRHDSSPPNSHPLVRLSTTLDLGPTYHVILLRYSFPTLIRPLNNPGGQNTRKQPFLREITIPDSQPTVLCEFKVRTRLCATFKFAQTSASSRESAVCRLFCPKTRKTFRNDPKCSNLLTI